MTGISRKLPDTERARLKAILKEVVPEDAGVIVRTAAEGAREEELRARRRAAHRAVGGDRGQGEVAAPRSRQRAPALLHGEPDLTVRVVRDVFNEDFTKLVVQGDEAWDDRQPVRRATSRPTCADAAHALDRDEDVFAAYRIDEQLAKALDRKVWLPSGGSLVIDRTEAMTVVDVNTGKFVGSGRQPRGDRHQEQPRGRRGDRPPAAAARHRRHHRHRLHRHGAGVQPRPRAAPPARVPRPGPHQAPGRRGHLARPGPDDPQAGRPGAARGLQRAVRGLRRPRRHRAHRAGRPQRRHRAVGSGEQGGARRGGRRGTTTARRSRHGRAAGGRAAAGRPTPEAVRTDRGPIAAAADAAAARRAEAGRARRRPRDADAPADGSRRSRRPPTTAETAEPRRSPVEPRPSRSRPEATTTSSRSSSRSPCWCPTPSRGSRAEPSRSPRSSPSGRRRRGRRRRGRVVAPAATAARDGRPTRPRDPAGGTPDPCAADLRGATRRRPVALTLGAPTEPRSTRRKRRATISRLPRERSRSESEYRGVRDRARRWPPGEGRRRRRRA